MTREDFRILDNGVEQSVQVFAIESSEMKSGADAGQAPALAPNTWTNRAGRVSGAPRSVTLILLDGLNSNIQDQAHAREHVVRFLEQLHPDDRVALYALGKELLILHDFTRDASSLLQALSRYKGHNSGEVNDSSFVSNPTGTKLDAFLRAADQNIQSYSKFDRAMKTVDALEALANHVAGIPGRKNLIWVSGGFPISVGRLRLTPETERAARALENANLAVYPVDSRGILTTTAPAQNANPMSQFTGLGGAAPDPMPDPERDSLDEMIEIATRTGGRAAYNTNDLASAIRRAIDDSRLTYELGFYPAHGVWNGKFHEIKVTVKRSDVRLRFRRGYYAFPDKAPEVKSWQEALVKAEVGSNQATAIGVTLHGDRTAAGTPDQLKLLVEVDPRDMHFEDEEGNHVSLLAIGFLQAAQDGKIVAHDVKMVNVRLKDGTYRTVMAQGFSVTRALDLDPAAFMVRVVVCDKRTGQAGSVDIPLPGGPRIPNQAGENKPPEKKPQN